MIRFPVRCHGPVNPSLDSVKGCVINLTALICQFQKSIKALISKRGVVKTSGSSKRKIGKFEKRLNKAMKIIRKVSKLLRKINKVTSKMDKIKRGKF